MHRVHEMTPAVSWMKFADQGKNMHRGVAAVHFML